MLFTSQGRSVLGKTVPSVFCTARAIYIIYICILFLFPCLYVRSILVALFLSSKNAIIVNTILLLSKEFISREEIHKSIIL